MALDSPLPDVIAAALRRLSRYYIPTRYPDAHPGGSPGEHFGSDDAESGLRDADAAVEAVECGRWLVGSPDGLAASDTRPK